MDAHVFRIIGNLVLELLHHARIEKIYSPFPDITVFSCFRDGMKFRLVLRSGKKSPSLFIAQSSLPNPTVPKAYIMRLRKYASSSRLGMGTIDIAKRILSIPLLKQEPLEQAWLVLDIKKGAYIQDHDICVTPECWPEEKTIQWLCKDKEITIEEQQNKDWHPMLTPLLRETLAELSFPDAMALMVDLETGGEDLFFYGKRESEAQQYSAWPLPEELLIQKKLKEIPSSSFTTTPKDIGNSLLMGVSSIDEGILLADYSLKKHSLEQIPQKKEKEKNKKALLRLEQEEKRLLALQEQFVAARHIQDNLWQYPADCKLPSLCVQDAMGSVTTITLNPYLTLRENMTKMFHLAAKGKRGLAIVKERRRELEKKAKDISDTNIQVAVKNSSPQSCNKNFKKRSTTEEKNVMAFTSSDGYSILRGKNAKGNQQVLKMAQPNDYWLHGMNGPSAHAILRRAHSCDDPPKVTLEEAAELVAEKSCYRNDTKAEIMFCLAKHVHPIKGASPGTVKVDKIAIQMSIRRVIY